MPVSAVGGYFALIGIRKFGPGDESHAVKSIGGEVEAI